MIPTPLETTGAETTWADEEQFFTDLAADSPRVAVYPLGETVNGRTISLVGIGKTAPPDPRKHRHESILAVGMQHGHEPAAREATIKWARDLAYSEDPEVVSYLYEHPVWIIPTVNADSVPTGVTENQHGVNLNRDHTFMTEPETHAIHRAIGWLKPHILIDLHEGAFWDLQVAATSIHPGANQALNPFAHPSMMAARNAAQAAGYTQADWGAGDDERTLRSASTLRGSLGILFESAPDSGDLAWRAGAHVAGAFGVLKWHRLNIEGMREAVAEAWKPTPTLYLTAEIILDPSPTGYRLTQAQYDAVANHREHAGIQFLQEQGGTWLVTLNQHSGQLVPRVMDAEARWETIAAERVYDPIPDYVRHDSRAWFKPAPEYGPPIESVDEWGPIRIDGVNCHVTEVLMQTDVGLVTIYRR